MILKFLSSFPFCWLEKASMPVKDESHLVGDITRELWECFNSQAGDTQTLSIPVIRPLLNRISLYPSKSQIHEMVHCACESSGRTPVDHITFGEFCILVTELQELYRKCPSVPLPRSLVKDRHALEERRRKRRLSGAGSSFQVFLGGSCNPTTWRADKAIPFLKQYNITYFNPQVKNWKPELMELEDQAKQTAELLFFVIDNETRSTASMVEASYLAGCGRQLILIIKDFAGPGAVIAGETISTVEYEDLERSHAFLTDLVERQSIPVFSRIEEALHCTKKAVTQNIRVSDLTLADSAQPVKFPHGRVADKFIQLKDAYNAVDTENAGRIGLKDANLAFRTIAEDDLPVFVQESHGDRTFTFEEFCCLASEYKYKRRSWWRKLLGGIARIPAKILDWLRGHSGTKYEDSLRQRDIFLGGTCGHTTWREDTAIPLLRKQGISFFNPQLPDWNTHYIPLEAAVKENCRLLLYVVTADTRGITSMLEASHYIGQGCNVVLCLQNLKDGVVIDNEELTPTAVKDYNRARSYLADLANRDGIPIFDDIGEAVECCVHKLRMADEKEKH